MLASLDELAVAGRFRFARHRREYLVARALVRSVLGWCAGRSPTEWRFTRERHGRPRAVAAGGLGFSLATHPTLVACAVADHDRIGVDVEPWTRAEAILEVAALAFSPRERAALAELPAAVVRDRALSLWTVKEAYVKALGVGLTAPLDAIDVELGAAGPVLVGPDAARWSLRTLDIAGHRLAIAHAGPLAAVEPVALAAWDPEARAA